MAATLSNSDYQILKCKTDLTQDIIEKKHKEFISKYPSGFLTRQEFLQVFNNINLHTKGSASDIFDIFDDDGSDTMDFLEFILAEGVVGLGTPREKLNWIFNVFDKDGGGVIDHKEIRDLLYGLFTMAGIKLRDDILDERLNEMLGTIDMDGSGEIEKEEFIKNAMKCGFICDIANGISQANKRRKSDFEILSQKTNLPEEEINKKHKKFLSDYPSGFLTKQEFLHTFKEANWKKKEIACDIFTMFDEDGSNTMDFKEYMIAEDAVNLASPREKLNWIFNVFDKDGGGVIDHKEMKDVVLGLFTMAGIRIHEDILVERLKEMLEAIDMDGDGEIEKEEFIKNAMKCGFICDIVKGDVVNGISQL